MLMVYSLAASSGESAIKLFISPAACSFASHIALLEACVKFTSVKVRLRDKTLANGSFARYKLKSWLNFIATELHKNFTPLFDSTTIEVAQQSTQQQLTPRFYNLDQQLGALKYLVGDYFTIADAYLFTVLGRANIVKFVLSPNPHLLRYSAHCKLRPAVQAVMAAEGL